MQHNRPLLTPRPTRTRAWPVCSSIPRAAKVPCPCLQFRSTENRWNTSDYSDSQHNTVSCMHPPTAPRGRPPTRSHCRPEQLVPCAVCTYAPPDQPVVLVHAPHQFLRSRQSKFRVYIHTVFTSSCANNTIFCRSSHTRFVVSIHAMLTTQ
jgi:hypothetical protein